MIAIIDDANKNIYFISDGIKKFSFPEAFEILKMFQDETISVVPVQSIPARNLMDIMARGLPSQNNVKVVASTPSSSSSDMQYIVPTRASAVIVAGLNPPLMFENGYDCRNVDSIKNSYGGSIPHQIEKLIANGKLKYVDSSAVPELERKKNESIQFAKRKHKNGGRKVDSDDSFDIDSDDSDDRRVRNAARINL